ncbi:MAG: hypothetical protein LBH25_03410 [Fibromonadaceae bacterium]|jgi:hypothetical protein|nr:hypothetical protein [Fibromonadaceae bacterium]
MKKSLLLVIAFVTFASAQGSYFDAGFGLGRVKTKIGGKDYVREANSLLVNNAEEDGSDTEFNVKIGYGPFGLGIGPLYVVADLGMIEHNIFNYLDGDDKVNFITYTFGPSVAFYPVSSIQIGLSAGVSVTTVEMIKENLEIDSDLGYMYSVSAAYDFGANLTASIKELVGNHSLLIGVKHVGAKNPTYVSGKNIKTEMQSIFIKYAYIHR